MPVAEWKLIGGFCFQTSKPTEENSMRSVPVIYCCVKNFWKHRGLKQYYLSWFSILIDHLDGSWWGSLPLLQSDGSYSWKHLKMSLLTCLAELGWLEQMGADGVSPPLSFSLLSFFSCSHSVLLAWASSQHGNLKPDFLTGSLLPPWWAFPKGSSRSYLSCNVHSTAVYWLQVSP